MAKLAVAIGLFALILVTAPLVAVAYRAGGLGLSAADWSALRFTLWQALLSAILSVLLAIPVAKALSRRHFFGRSTLITLLGAPFLLPVIVAVMGLLALFGRSGVLNTALSALGLPTLSIYGLQGVLIAHVFLNFPLATRMILQGWQAIPAERFRLAESLSFTPREIHRHLERPMLIEVLPGTFATIFAMCLTSFAVALILGGGPRATTLELAIYQAVRFEFDLAHAAGLALLQVLVGGLAALVAWIAARQAGFGAGLDRRLPLPAPTGWRLWLDSTAILFATLFLLGPMLAVLLPAISGLLDLPSQVWPALARSLAVALGSTLLTCVTALVLALGAARGQRWLDIAATLPLATSGLVLGTGLFVLLQPLIPPASLALPVTLLVNTLLALPFAYRLLLPEARALETDYGRLADSLGLHGLARLRLLSLPRLARPLGFSAGLTAALSMGDLGVIALFASESQATLPLVIQRLSGAYKQDVAAAASVLLVASSFALFWLFDRKGRNAQA
ncbi:thiamine/thiamine pyrophosphate ABC transporter permease ThiP [Xinfangfangia sp. CPCC 101601]|uniref:Thiamine/thiamine pyrophosphate ABC transporter permease ThiP n=1 Tax=Pseudogemmobacter lacusdianii TaxID=3069608 RepID=A0ABU0VU32_9RHOB|nr:thiamine/thiamine pyrophosphate ABC transporter permease ThiP [Xinfangfangia sp. CPCC 101601]MDQ2065236.1 thiamine/thiamine pyrophosphate ABC transporter permease ThiP [Xinfangfangia sp. CPCC 101601]